MSQADWSQPFALVAARPAAPGGPKAEPGASAPVCRPGLLAADPVSLRRWAWDRRRICSWTKESCPRTERPRSAR